MTVRTIYDRLPEYFCQRYEDWIIDWGRNFRRHGTQYRVMLREGPHSDLSPNPEQGPVLLAVDLLADIGRNERTGEVERITIRPATEQDEALIRRHCEKLVRLRVQPREFWREPPRAGLPFGMSGASAIGEPANENGRGLILPYRR